MNTLFCISVSALLLWDQFTTRAAEFDNKLGLDSIPAAHFEFHGIVGERVTANVENWLLRAPQSNPGMLEMFRVRDRKPAPQIVPWAGEFVGKYLISAVQALRMSNDPRLREHVSKVVADLIATQAEDGYLGPFPKEIRLQKNWDLWGHYHVIYALVLWHEQTGDPTTLAAARKAADLVCATFLDINRRVLDAGDSEMNMSILTAMAMLHRITGEPRYLRMAREVEKDWERAGDYLRAGLDGREFYQSPKPRWESLHDLQGLVELWRITSEAKYRDAFEHHWRSIRRWDRRNTGGFSSGEQATGNPFAPTAIETCCTVAWMALTIDYLRLTGDPRAADELELATFNAGLGAQHPSGRWWTYNTPMDGVREASAHTIVFQSRAGTPELNCCSVNGPRVLGMLSEWAVMRAPDGLTINWYGPVSVSTKLPDGAEIKLTCDSNYPREETARWKIELPPGSHQFTLRFRLPAWSAKGAMKLNGVAIDIAASDRYQRINRKWQNGDIIESDFDLSLRTIPGANEAAGKVSLYRGPLLLAYDQRFNDYDEDGIPKVDVSRLNQAQIENVSNVTNGNSLASKPWVLVEAPSDGRALRLVDFASAGASGTRYRSWLTPKTTVPAPAITRLPKDGARIAAGEVRFQWRGSEDSSYRLEFSTNDLFNTVSFQTNAQANRLTIDTRPLLRIPTENPPRFWWRVVTVNPNQETIAEVPPAIFTIDSEIETQPLSAVPITGPNNELIVHSLRSAAGPEFGQLMGIRFDSRNIEGTELNGRDQMIVYAVPEWPEEDFTVALRVRFAQLPQGHLGQVFSAWTKGSDDPLRLVVDGGKLFARIEAGVAFSTPGVPIETNRWYALVAVKQASTLKLYLDGKPAGTCPAPEFSTTQAKECALGGNPRYGGNEFLAARFADFRFYGRALNSMQIQRFAADR